VADHEELVGYGELHVTPGIREQLREFRLLRRGSDRLRRQSAKERFRACRRVFLIGSDDLGEHVQFVEGKNLLRSARDRKPYAR